MPATKGVLVVEVTNATANGAAVAGDRAGRPGQFLAAADRTAKTLES